MCATVRKLGLNSLKFPQTKNYFRSLHWAEVSGLEAGAAEQGVRRQAGIVPKGSDRNGVARAPGNRCWAVENLLLEAGCVPA